MREEYTMLRQISMIAFIALVAVCGVCLCAHAADTDKLLRHDGGGSAAAGPEAWAKLYPMPAYEFGLTASG
jgi:hypothetical protein